VATAEGGAGLGAVAGVLSESNRRPTDGVKATQHGPWRSWLPSRAKFRSS
jgi:hypothetical protein